MISKALVLAFLMSTVSFLSWIYRKKENEIKKNECVSIAIFGSKGAGKTTLWSKLQGVFEDKEYHPTLGTEDVNQFTIEYNGKRKVITKSKDFGGGDDVVRYYGDIIKEDTFVYYLIDLTTLEKFRRETRARLQYLSQVVKQKQLKDKVRLRLVATHYREYLRNNPGKTRPDVIHELASVIGLNNIRDVKIEERIMVAELTEKEDINQIFEQIIQTN